MPVEAELGRLAGEEDGLSVAEKEAKMTDPAQVQKSRNAHVHTCIYTCVCTHTNHCIAHPPPPLLTPPAKKKHPHLTLPSPKNKTNIPQKNTGAGLRRPHAGGPGGGDHRQRPRALRGAAPAARPAPPRGDPRGDGPVSWLVGVGLGGYFWVIVQCVCIDGGGGDTFDSLSPLSHPTTTTTTHP